MIQEKPSQLSAHSLKKNISANFLGTIWQSLMGLIFIPFYIKQMGIESWGLIGIFATLQGIFGLLDVGLGSTVTREMARLSVLPDKAQEMRNLVRTLETLYWGIALFAGIVIVSTSPLLAHYWVNAGTLPGNTIEQAFIIMGIIMIFQMPIGFYSGGLMGLQKQVMLNVINVCISTLRGVGAVVVLFLVSPTIQAYLVWQIIMSMTNACLIALFLWQSLPYGEKRAVFQKQLLQGVWRFTAGMSGISIIAVILTQLDKVILSKLLSLELFGYYMLASMVAMSLGRLFTPFFFSIFPRFTQLVSMNDHEELVKLYHKSCQFLSVLILPAAAVIAFFSYEIMLVWTRNPATAENTNLIVSIMICGTALNGLMNPPYALQLAFGWTTLPLYANLISVIILAPMIIFMAAFYGAIGGAIAWLVLNIGYVIFWIPVMHKKLLMKEKWRWYWQDLGVPLVVCTTVAGTARILIQQPMPQYLMLVDLIFVSILTLGAAVFTTPVTRAWLSEQLVKIKLVYKT